MECVRLEQSLPRLRFPDGFPRRQYGWLIASIMGRSQGGSKANREPVRLGSGRSVLLCGVVLASRGHRSAEEGRSSVRRPCETDCFETKRVLRCSALPGAPPRRGQTESAP